jgi:calcium permeable stress-gated cation channel
MAFSRLAIGSIFRATTSGVLDAVPEPDQELEPDAPIPDPKVYGPNYVARTTEETTDPATLYSPGSAPTHLPSSNGDGDWVDVGREAPIDFRYSHTPSAPSPMPLVLPPAPEVPLQPARASSIFRFVRRPKIFGPAPSDHRSTFPLRVRAEADTGRGSGRSEEVPPHLRVQRAPPFVRPLTGLNHDELGAVYSEIRSWRTRLKTINEDIRIAQEDGYQAIADGAFVKGWLLTGRGLRFLPGIQLIEGRAKEDVRWDILQLDERDRMSWVAFWTIVVVIGVTLLCGCEPLPIFPFPGCALIRTVIAAAGLAVATSPDFAHYIPFFQSMANDNNLPTGLVTVLAPSAAAALFILLAILAIHRKCLTVTDTRDRLKMS